MPETGQSARTAPHTEQPAAPGHPAPDSATADASSADASSTAPAAGVPLPDQLAVEQQHVDRVYTRLDDELEQLAERGAPRWARRPRTVSPSTSATPRCVGSVRVGPPCSMRSTPSCSGTSTGRTG